YTKVSDIHRHLQRLIKCFHCFYAFYRRLHFVLSSFHTHHIDRKSCEPLRARVHHIPCPASPYGCKPCTVSNVKHSAQFMLQLMAGPVAAVRATSCKPVMGNTSRPHNLCPCLVVIRLIHKNPCILHHCTDQVLADAVSQFHILALIKVSLHSVHHNIHTPAGRLIFGQRHCKFRVHHRESCTGVIAAVSSLQTPVLIGNDRRITHL